MKKSTTGMLIDMGVLVAGVTSFFILTFIDWRIGFCVGFMIWGDRTASKIAKE